MRFLLTMIALLAATSAQAQDSWTGRDKALHLTLSAAMAGGCTVATGREQACFWGTVAVGAAKELYDAQHRDRHTPSWKDFGADVLGAYIGAKTGGWIVTRRGNTTIVAYTARL